MTRTYATLEISVAAFKEIFDKVSHHAIHEDNGKIVIDMHGIALKCGEPDCEPETVCEDHEIPECALCGLGDVMPVPKKKSSRPPIDRLAEISFDVEIDVQVRWCPHGRFVGCCFLCDEETGVRLR